MKANKVSIIIPAYNAGATIMECLNSVFEQTHTNIEIVVVNDGSTDNTEAILIDLITDKKIKYAFQENKGVSSARNLGLELSTGDYILFLDADDLLKNEAIAILLSCIKECDLIFGTWEDFNSVTKQVQKTFAYEIDNSNPIAKYFKYRPTISTALIKRDKASVWNTQRNLWEVTEFFLNIILEDSRICFVNKVVTSIRQHNSAHRISIKFDHFNAENTLDFFTLCKNKIINKKMLNHEIEVIIDRIIIAYSYEALKKDTERAKIKLALKQLNYGLINDYPDYKRFGIYHFIFLLHGFNGLNLFYKINKFFNRI